MELRLFNTLTRKIEPFEPERNGIVRLYTCGPTVYNYLHIGNYRTYVFEDALKRTMKALGMKVRHVMNITDVGHLVSDADEGADKMEKAASREGKTAWDIAAFYTQTFLDDAKKLKLDFHPVENPARKDQPKAEDILCKATDHIAEQIAMVEALKPFSYETKDGIYFNTAKFPDYGKLAGAAHVAGLQQGMRVAMGDKRNATDFALWKFSPEGEKRQMEWDYLGRKGFPGWHIECSAMAKTYLGETFDMHCGGVDHIPIHHTNEIAQAEAVSKKLFVHFWLHGEFLVVNEKKMAKSAGGFIRLQDLEDKGYDPLDYRYFCFGAHYRKQLEFSWEALDAAKTGRQRLNERVRTRISGDFAGKAADWIARFNEAIADDLAMPQALAVVHQALGELSGKPAREFIEAAESVLAVGLLDAPKDAALPPDAQALFEAYSQARKTKNFAESDRLRAALKDKGIQVLDSKTGSSWKKL